MPSDRARIFGDIYRRHAFRGESVSGPGSDDDQTQWIVQAVPALLHRLKVQTLLDLPCGDFGWMGRVLIAYQGDYLGADVVPELVDQNARRYSSETISFCVLDLVTDALPPVDLLLCRDCLVHLSFADIALALENILKSEITYLLSTTFPGRTNRDIPTGHWRPLDLTAAPFNLPRPMELIVEGCTEDGGIHKDKALGLWKLAR